MAGGAKATWRRSMEGGERPSGWFGGDVAWRGTTQLRWSRVAEPSRGGVGSSTAGELRRGWT